MADCGVAVRREEVVLLVLAGRPRPVVRRMHSILFAITTAGWPCFRWNRGAKVSGVRVLHRVYRCGLFRIVGKSMQVLAFCYIGVYRGRDGSGVE